ncbi:hypothetical protein [Burkholderia sp. NFACC33-1]|uniref:hypothetical protein n=2 Tax=Burkholderiaceae TaxID=119060 RepID=UPI000D7625F9|nr:hypothetical protein [Burkholderia sp. NFACC33-1]
MNATRARQLKAALAKNRMASGKSRNHEAGHAGNAMADIGDSHDAFVLAPVSDGDADDHRDGQRQSHRFHAPRDTDIESPGHPASAFALSEATYAGTALPPPARNGETTLETTIRTLLELRDSCAAHPHRAARHDVYTWLINLIASRRRADYPSVVSLSILHDACHRVVAERASSAASDGNRQVPHEGTQHFNALIGLLLLNTCRPSTPTQFEHAIVRLLALRRAVVSRVPDSSAS